MIAFSFQDVVIKLLSEDTSLFQILFVRSMIGIFLISAFLKISGKPIKWGTAYPVMSTLRGLLFFFGYSTFYFAQSKIPIANATVLFLVSPFFITILSIFIFGSQVGINRWITMIIGFSGVIIIAQPEVGMFDVFYLLPVAVALTYAISMMIAKKTSEHDTVYQQIIFMYIVTAVLSAVMGLSIGDGRFDTYEFVAIEFMVRSWNFDTINITLSLIAVAAIGTIAFLLLTTAYRVSDPASIAPFEYSGLLVTIVAGYLFWGDVLSLKEIVGMVLIVGSGIYLFYRENVKGVQEATETPLR
ncbi:MAG: drug/metabolite transporter (DMT)-like permease [Candidatus Azotimanducaceae bacterium]|jgi:drug/metabolite transporter (DMT)-like permease